MFEKQQRKSSGRIKASVQGQQPLASAFIPPLRSQQPAIIPQLQRQAQAAQQLAVQTLRPVAKQRQQAGAVFQALHLQREVVEGLKIQRSVLQQKVAEHLSSAGNLEGALQRQAVRQAPAAPLTQVPVSPAAWVQAARLEVQRVQNPAEPDRTRWLGAADRERHVGTLRSIGHGLAQGFKTDRGPAVQRYAEYGDGLATLQRQALMGSIPRMVLAQVSPAERPHLQRAVDEALQRQQEEAANDVSALHLHGLQRQLAELDHQAEQPIMERIQARRGSGTPLPVMVQRQLEAGLNHDLSGVRVHTDGEADLLSKKVNAVAFTTGQDIYFQSGKFDPNSRTGIELLAHEATHTVQQSKGKVGKGIDPDAGLEQEARQFGSQFSSVVSQADLHRSVSTARTPGSVSRRPTTSQLISGRLSASPVQRLSAPVLQRLGETPSPARVNSAEAGERGYVTAAQGVRLFSSPHQVGGPAHSALPIIAHGTILQLLEHQDGWYKVSTTSGVGYVEGQFIKVMPAGQRGLGDATKDPGAKIYRAKSGDTLLGLVQQHFGLKADKETFQKRGQDMRYFANVIVAANKPEAFQDKPSLLQSLYGVTVPGGDVLGKALIAQTDYLIPSYGFALAQTKNVPSGSLSAELGKLAVHMARFTQDYGVVKNIAQQKYYGPGIKRAVLDAPGQLLEGLVQFAVLSGGVLALTTGVGAAIGAFAGGVGAAPGAAIGFEAGLALLNYVGIGFLVVYVGKQLGAFGGALMQALKLTWNAQGDAKQLDLAARALSSALETLVGVLIQALIAYLTKESLGKLAKTPFGRQIGLAAKESTVGKWLTERGKQAGTLREGIKQDGLKAGLERWFRNRTELARVETFLKTATRFDAYPRLVLAMQEAQRMNNVHSIAGTLLDMARKDRNKAMGSEDFSRMTSEVEAGVGLGRLGLGEVHAGSKYAQSGRRDFDLGIEHGGKVTHHAEVFTPQGGNLKITKYNDLLGGISHAIEKVSGPTAARVGSAEIIAVIKAEFPPKTVGLPPITGHRYVNDGVGGVILEVYENGHLKKPISMKSIPDQLLQDLNKKKPGLDKVVIIGDGGKVVAGFSRNSSGIWEMMTESRRTSGTVTQPGSARAGVPIGLVPRRTDSGSDTLRVDPKKEAGKDQ